MKQIILISALVLLFATTIQGYRKVVRTHHGGGGGMLGRSVIGHDARAGIPHGSPRGHAPHGQPLIRHGVQPGHGIHHGRSGLGHSGLGHGHGHGGARGAGYHH